MVRISLLFLSLALMSLAIGCEKKKSGTPEELRRAVRTGDIELVRSLISGGTDISVKTWPDWNPLHDAAACGHKDVAELLIAKGVEIDARDQWLRTPLLLALSTGKEDVAELLIANGADVNAVDTYGRTPLLCAFHWTSEHAVELLISKGADVDVIIQPHTYTFGIFALVHKPLHDAARLGYKNVTELLIEKGADVNAKDGDGRTPLSYAQEQGHAEIVELLRKHGAKEGKELLDISE